MKQQSNRWWIYFLPLVCGWVVWWLAFSKLPMLPIIASYWESAVTMIAGSFIAGSTPLGGGAVAFPVFTKLFDVSTEDARLFSLMIQSVGMSFATLFFISRGVKIYWGIIFLGMIGSIVGLWLGINVFHLNGVLVKFLFAEFIVITAFLIIQSKLFSNQEASQRYEEYPFNPVMIMLVGLTGGLLSAEIGTGADTLLFFLLVFVLGNSPKAAIPTTVSFMALTSLIGCFILLNKVAPPGFVLNSFWVSAPVVSLGAPLGAWVLGKLSGWQIRVLLICAFCLEITSTFMFSPLSYSMKLTLLLSLLMGVFLWFRNGAISAAQKPHQRSKNPLASWRLGKLRMRK